MIPKVIHYCWFGKNKKSKLIEKCIKSWKKYCSDYEIKEWNEDNFDININEYVKEAYQQKKWAFVSDYVRLWVVYNYGGIYLDTDVEIIKKIDDLLVKEAFFCFEDEKYIATGLGFGGQKNNKVVKKMLDDYENIHFIDEKNIIDTTPCPIRNTKSIENIINIIPDRKIIYEKDNITFYPKEYFCPLDYETGELNITKNTIGIHWYNASWFSKKEKIRRNITKIIKRIIGKENFKRIINKKGI